MAGKHEEVGSREGEIPEGSIGILYMMDFRLWLVSFRPQPSFFPCVLSLPHPEG